MPVVRWRSLVHGAPLVAALVASVVAYWPALRSPFYGDDYLYLSASRSLSFGEYARASLVPYSDQPALVSVTQFFWRPLYYLSFGLLEPLFGDRPVAYHLLLLGIHLASVALVWLLVKQLARSWAAAGFAAVVFAAHPAAYEGVAWVSSLSNVGLPLMLAAWLLFARAVQTEPLSRRNLIASALLVAVALGFRESTVVILPAMGLWWLATRETAVIRDPQSYRVFGPLLVVGLVYLVVRTRFFTASPANSDIWAFDGDTLNQYWYYIKQTVFPASGAPTGLAHGMQVLTGIVVLAALPVLLVFRRWVAAALLAGAIVSVFPYAPLTLAVSPRYVYFPAAFLAIAAGFLFHEAIAIARPALSDRLVVGGATVISAALLIAGTASISLRVDDWVESGPDVEQGWVDELRVTFPELEPGSTLFCANTPLILALFDDVLLAPTVQFYYPGVSARRFEVADLSKIEVRTWTGGSDLHSGGNSSKMNSRSSGFMIDFA